MTDVVLACADLMTSSRLVGEGLDVQRCSSAERALTALEGVSDPVVVVDLAAFGELPRRLREQLGFEGRIVGFAPHVRTDLLEAARPWCSEVVPRGAIVKHFSRYAGIQSAPAEGDAPP